MTGVDHVVRGPLIAIKDTCANLKRYNGPDRTVVGASRPSDRDLRG